MSIKPIDTATVDELSSSLSSLKSVFENIGNFAEEYRASIGSATETISYLNNETLQLTTTLSNQKTNIPDLIADQIAKLNVTDDLANEIQKLTTVANNFNENLNVGSFKSIESTLEQINNRLMRFSDELVGITNETRDNIEKLETGLIQITKSVVKSINEQ